MKKEFQMLIFEPSCSYLYKWMGFLPSANTNFTLNKIYIYVVCLTCVTKILHSYQFIYWSQYIHIYLPNTSLSINQSINSYEAEIAKKFVNCVYCVWFLVDMLGGSFENVSRWKSCYLTSKPKDKDVIIYWFRRLWIS